MENIRTIIATEHDGIDTRVLVINVRVLNGDLQVFNLEGAVQKAVHEFLCTKEGIGIYESNCEIFDWGDFEQNVPNEICRKHGFEKIESTLSDLNVNWDEHLADDEALNKFWEEREQE